ncbi:ribosomal protein S18 acetylase RimI-like enzyme [Peteryoungia aggregata LMG 23059]|uniref:Ribosomal protein S18 acetylase RimI-like enzyme n=1 Tax=Peteryoungia aggregata LMG 23059 TaxID=1368425 RepID=A0ABU0GEF2_9HYPH|nr:GNAT family N-acetyltransferase [Peteryoungia aggregata]MDQ0422965.1 ribosomal protein S18 acetylase RimI-like enzyme [Peteryoungia aggregata LMG 23059]
MNDEGHSVIIELLDPERHDRDNFSCGVETVDNYFRKTANKLAKAGNARVYVMTSEKGDVIGFYALNAHSVDFTELPSCYARSRPSHGAIPAAFISMIGVDQRYAGQGYGGDLLADALLRIVQAAERIGIAVVILDVLDDGNPDLVQRRKALYLRYGFEPLPSNPLRLFIPVAAIRKTLATS